MDVTSISSGDLKADVKIEKGVIVISAKLDSAGVGAGLSVTVPTDYFLDLLAAKIPGTMDDAVIALVKSALKSI